MASIDKRPDGRWRARWREHPGARERSKHFARRVDAERFLVGVQHDLLVGRYVDPRAGRVTVDDFAASWVQRRAGTWRPSTRDRVERELRLYVLPAFGGRPLVALRRADIERWAAELPLAASSTRRVVETLRTMLAAAVDDELLARNPTVGARLPAEDDGPVVPLELGEVRAIAQAIHPTLRAAVRLSADTGLRQGEAMGLTIDRVDFLRRELRVDRQLYTPSRGAPVLVAPKTKRGFRTIALASSTVEVLAAHVAQFGTGEHGLVFHTAGRPVGRATLSQRFNRAASAAGVRVLGDGGRTAVSWHDLRHHHASVLLSHGVSPALVAERLGHDVGTLLSTYAHVIRSDEDRVRALVDASWSDPLADFSRTRGLS